MHNDVPLENDPVRRRRQLIAVWTRRANQCGYLLFAVAIVLFIVAFTTDFSDTMATLITIALVVGSVLLAPAIVLGYAIKAAEKRIRDPSGKAELTLDRQDRKWSRARYGW